MKKNLPSKGSSSVKGFFMIGLLLLLSLHSTIAQGQKRELTGTITSSDDGTTLPGVNIIIEGTGQGTVTDIDGNYKIMVPNKETTLVFSSIGYLTQKVVVTDETKMDLVMDINIESLEEVVVIGYGTQKKKEVTGAVGNVDGETLTRSATADLGTALQGQVAGVNVTASSGEPGSSSNIVIRGLSSVTGNSAPLYVVDGIPYNGDPKLSMNEIESIDILKDAASAAIYGTRGAGGVILITTKQGKAGVMKVGLDSYYGVQKITSDVPLMNFDQYMYSEFLSKYNQNGTNYGNSWTPLENNLYSFTNDTDWAGIIQNDNATIQNHSLNISGGKEGLNYNITGTYFNQEGVIINSGFDRFNIRANTGYTKGKWVINTGLGIRLEEQEYAPWNFLLDAYKQKPYQQEIDPSASTISDASGSTNDALNLSYMAARMKQTDVRSGDHFNGFFQARYNLSKSFNIMSRMGGSITNNTRVRVNPLFKVYNELGELLPTTVRSGIYNFSDRSKSFTSETTLNYHKKFGEHSLKVLGLFSMERYEYTSFFAEKFDLISNDVLVLNGATLDPNVGSGSGYGQDRVNSLIGFLGRAQYDYKGKYLLSVSARRDGSSRFSKDYRWGVFPSVSAGWNVSDEDFWNSLAPVANSFKIRGSFGTTGNQNFLDYSNAATISLAKDYVFGPEGSDHLVLGAIQTAFANENVKWETTEQANLGFDLAFFENKFTFSADFYNTNKKDMLFPLLLPPTTGAGSNATVILNVGNMNNRGMEFTANYRHKGKFSWSAGLTFGKNNNKITKMSGANKIAYLSGSTVTSGLPNEDLVTVLKEGYEAGAFFVLKTDGLITSQEELQEYREIMPTAKMGDLKYVDALTVDTDGDGVPDAGDGLINNDDRVYAGSGMPEFEMGLNLNADYKGFDLSMQWYGAFGGEIINGSKAYAYKQGTHLDILYQWSPQNTTSTIPAYRGRDHENYRGYTDYWIEDGTFIRLRNVALGYTIPSGITNKVGVRNFRVYIAAQNPLTITSYDGFDPEVGNDGLNTRGIDKGNYPISAQYRAGIQFDF
ncbi:SusC/RagA family TonB-linked outer membrane protein [Echinicola strongylocentroti]|nr:TonB-dependent receptor [Echinicola strongylocentroti]